MKKHFKNYKRFSSRTFLQQPDFQKPFILNTDVSQTAISVVLMQDHNGTFIPVSYFSKTLKKAETR